MRLDSEAQSSDLWAFPQCLRQACLGSRVLQLHSFNAADVVQVARKLTVRGILREGRLRNEVSGLLIQALLQVAADDDVHEGGLSGRVKVQTAAFVRLEDLGPDCGQHVASLVSNRHEVNGFRLQGIDRATVYQVESQENKIAEFFGLSVVSIGLRS